MSFLAIKVIFKSVINYGCNLVQIQQIPLTEEKQWWEKLRNIIIIISETLAFFQARLTNRCWCLWFYRRPSYTLPGLPRHSKGISKQGYMRPRVHMLPFLVLQIIYLAWQYLTYSLGQRQSKVTDSHHFLTPAVTVPSDLLVKLLLYITS